MCLQKSIRACFSDIGNEASFELHQELESSDGLWSLSPQDQFMSCDIFSFEIDNGKRYLLIEVDINPSFSLIIAITVKREESQA